ncbi:receptor-type tyrosine-protein phosphatase epsilon-like isoform X1 [Acipenser ruthenus]|uniref:receptor-type tyrosine-protein phosphatase epsilon-like isoform X1 n=1 Tax=Acipenser ruthenus TaxID=7906 RepID=UPI0027421A6F|nr:receptor-type tyrosine-protein phosphatase epsilon-like isoform X1 [Acipenser ruthenus]XP_033886690.2 receptor-type tyrosine-protein phosphatase epsilon-like isoform X1 [Acipenser ruthenus]XP_058841188.1 receptor-type tyrosine-protein phosphatase epsilon-like isoform X1 [Acipenser ruthenus]
MMDPFHVPLLASSLFLSALTTMTLAQNNTGSNSTSNNPGTNTDSNTGSNTNIVMPLLVLLLLLLICILSAVYFLRFRKQRKADVTTVDKKIPNGILEEQDLIKAQEDNAGELSTPCSQEQQTVMLLTRSPSASKKYFPIPVDCLEEEYRIHSADDGKLFREEFNSLPNGYTQGTCEEANREDNKEKNRYPNILPYDHSRVILTQIDGNPCSDYINASYIDGYKEKNRFIAAQGPKQETIADFWRMIWEQKSATIVMLTNLKERKEDKCDQYWPDQGCWTYGNVRVVVEDFTILVDYTIRKFCVQYQTSEGSKAPRLITQLHFTSWPDFGVPFTPIGMLKFLKKVKTVNPSFAGPIVVHCSAGVGRTGTFIVIDAMIDMMHAEQKVDVFALVSRIREQRSQLVQTDMQYSFIYQALLEYYLYGDTELDVSSLEGHLQKLHNTMAPFDRIGLEEEFKKLTNVRIMKENMRMGNLPANMKKNRVLQIIPYDFNRVILSMKRGQENTDYINASFIDGYRQKDYFIATQGPLSQTVDDFWRMVWEWKSHSIVMLTELQEREQDKCFQYWPSEGSVTHGDWTVEIKGDARCDTCSVRDFMLSFSPEKQTRLVRQFHFHGWPEIGIPADGKGMIDIIAAVQKQQQQSGNHPIIVHCSAGAGRTGTFVALSNILERVKAEGLLDVFQTVKSLRMQRPHMVQTLEQYDFCYRVVQDFVDIFSDYANFK